MRTKGSEGGEVGGSTLAIGSELAGRYRIEAMIGRGGMGAVYRAYDRELERPVAIKVQHDADERLRREAIAMAKLAHPNVIPVFEVGDGFVVMELVTGRTLRAWLRERPRTRRERLTMVLAAGAGLVAAHEAGLIHRDFKPENVLVGDDDRPRVGDFGLVVAHSTISMRSSMTTTVPDLPPSGSMDTLPAPTSVPPATPSGILATPLTAAGAVLGTPLYMPPEQARGEALDDRADQFAFAVVAWEVLAGERPFAGATLAEVVAAIDTRERRGAANIPSAIRAVLDRGLAAKPAARYPSVEALLDDLRSASRAPIRRAAVAAFAAVTIAVAVLGATRHAEPSCERAAEPLAAYVSDNIAVRVAAIDPKAAKRISAGVAKFQHGLVAASVDVCVARRSGAISGDVEARTQRCLTIAARAVGRVLAEVPTTRDEVATAAAYSDELVEQLDPCADRVALVAHPPVPDDQVDAFIDASAELMAGTRDVLVGANADLRARVAAVEHSPVVANPEIAGELELLRGRIAGHLDDPAAARAHYEHAYSIARGADAIALGASALTELLIASLDTGDAAALHTWVELAIADADRAKTRLPHAAAMLYAHAASAVVRSEQPDRALEWSRRALDLVGPEPTLDRAQALAIAAEVECATGRHDECFANHRAAIGILRDRLGPDNAHVANLIGNAVLDYDDAGRAREALDLVREGEHILETATLSPLERATMLVNFAATLQNADVAEQRPHARAMLEEARQIVATKAGDRYPLLIDIAVDLSEIDESEGDLVSAAAKLDGAALLAETIGGSDGSDLAGVLYNAADVASKRGKLDDARQMVERSVAIRAKRMPGSTENARSLLLAAHVANLRGDPATAKARAREALAFKVVADPLVDRAWAELELATAAAALHEPIDRAQLAQARTIFVKFDDDRYRDVDALTK